jgi:hypothetical protein
LEHRILTSSEDMFKSEHCTFYVQSFLALFPYKFFGVKNANPSFYAKHVENGYCPLPSKFEMCYPTLRVFMASNTLGRLRCDPVCNFRESS